MRSKPLPRENLFRMRRAGLEIRAAEGDAQPRLVGHFAVFNEWTEIASVWEGNFMERIAPGAFTRTFADDREQMRVLFQHGRDPQLGMKAIASIEELREDDAGAYYEAPLYRGIPELVMDGLRDGQYGASFKFKVTSEQLVEKPKPSKDNPRALPERTVTEAKVYEFGPVTFPAYASATAGVRSLTDEFLTERDRELLTTMRSSARASSAATQAKFKTREEFLKWISSF